MGALTGTRRLEDVMNEPAFDMDLFMRICGWHHWGYEPDSKNPDETILWWNQECMTFGRVGDRFFYDDVDDWDQMDAFFAQYPEAEITSVRHNHWFGAVEPARRKGYVSVHARLTAPWPMTFDEAFDLLIRWKCEAEEDRAELRRAYDRAARRQIRPTRGTPHTLT
jgi:hypothetical protein